jgi:hypothetical protein
MLDHLQVKHNASWPIRVVHSPFVEEVNCSPKRAKDDGALPQGVEIDNIA